MACKRSLIACLVLFGFVTGCDSGSRHATTQQKLDSVANVRRAFATVGIDLGPNLLAVQPSPFTSTKSVRASFVSGDGSTAVTVYGDTKNHVFLTVGETKVASSRNIVVTSTEQSKRLKDVRRAIRILKNSVNRR
jgi:hypothetical protein